MVTITKNVGNYALDIPTKRGDDRTNLKFLTITGCIVTSLFGVKKFKFVRSSPRLIGISRESLPTFFVMVTMIHLFNHAHYTDSNINNNAKLATLTPCISGKTKNEGYSRLWQS